MKCLYIFLSLLAIAGLVLFTFYLLDKFSKPIIIETSVATESNIDPNINTTKINDFYKDFSSQSIALAGFVLTIIALFFSIINLFIYNKSLGVMDQVRFESNKLYNTIDVMTQRIRKEERSTYQIALNCKQEIKDSAKDTKCEIDNILGKMKKKLDESDQYSNK